MDYNKQCRQHQLEWLRGFNKLFGIAILALIAALIFGSPIIIREWPKASFFEKALILVIGSMTVVLLIMAVPMWLSSKREQKELKQETLKEGGVIE